MYIYCIYCTWAKEIKKSCSCVILRPGSGKYSLWLAVQLVKPWYAAFSPPLSAMFSPNGYTRKSISFFILPNISARILFIPTRF